MFGDQSRRSRLKVWFELTLAPSFPGAPSGPFAPLSPCVRKMTDCNHACAVSLKPGRLMMHWHSSNFWSQLWLTLSPLAPGMPPVPLSPGMPCRPGGPWDPGAPAGPMAPWIIKKWKKDKKRCHFSNIIMHYTHVQPDYSVLSTMDSSSVAPWEESFKNFRNI